MKKAAVERLFSLCARHGAHKAPRLRIAASSVARFKGKLKAAFRTGRGRAL
ncbi:hypothetical protein EV291_15720, partial [Rhizobium sp. BK068]